MKFLLLLLGLIPAVVTGYSQTTDAQGNRTFTATNGEKVVLSNDEKVFTKSEIAASFPGGDTAWIKFLQTHLEYPRKAIKKKVEGRVILQFQVDTLGRVFALDVVTGDELLTEAALKAMKNTPNWIPAFQNGRRVVSYAKQPFYFKLPD